MYFMGIWLRRHPPRGLERSLSRMHTHVCVVSPPPYCDSRQTGGREGNILSPSDVSLDICRIGFLRKFIVFITSLFEDFCLIFPHSSLFGLARWFVVVVILFLLLLFLSLSYYIQAGLKATAVPSAHPTVLFSPSPPSPRGGGEGEKGGRLEWTDMG